MKYPSPTRDLTYSRTIKPWWNVVCVGTPITPLSLPPSDLDKLHYQWFKMVVILYSITCLSIPYKHIGLLLALSQLLSSNGYCGIKPSWTWSVPFKMIAHKLTVICCWVCSLFVVGLYCSSALYSVISSVKWGLYTCTQHIVQNTIRNVGTIVTDSRPHAHDFPMFHSPPPPPPTPPPLPTPSSCRHTGRLARSLSLSLSHTHTQTHTHRYAHVWAHTRTCARTDTHTHT